MLYEVITAKLELRKQQLVYAGEAENRRSLAKLATELAAGKAEFEQLMTRQSMAKADLNQYVTTFSDANGTLKTIPAFEIVRHYQPNSMSVLDKSLTYLSKLVELFVGEPRESNTEGGLFPAIFGTVMLIFRNNFV